VTSLQIVIRESGDVAILDLSGNWTIDDCESEMLRRHIRCLQEMATNGVRKFLLNLADLAQIDSSGVSAIVRTYRSLRDQGCDLSLLRPNGRALEVFKVLHLLEVIPSFENENLALASFGLVRDFAKT